jgi:hypothetical protein
MKPTPAITKKQQIFIDCYDGDIEKSAEKAGITYGYARRLMVLPKHSHIAAAIRSREVTRSNKRIATREERQQFWSLMMTSKENARDRLKASELLGKSEADFVERKRIEDADGKPLKWRIEVVTGKGDN